MEGQDVITQKPMSEDLESVLAALDGTGSAGGEAVAELIQKVNTPTQEANPEPINENPLIPREGSEKQVEAPAATEQKQEEVKAEDKKPEQEFVVDSPLMKIAKEKQAEETISLDKIDGIEKVNEILSKELPEVKDLPTLLESYKELSTKLSDYEQVKKTNEDFINGFRNLHPDLIKAIELHETGQDFREYISGRPNVDFTKDVKNIDKIDLIKAYFPDKITADDIEAMDEESDYYDPKVARYINTLHENAVAKFNAEKKESMDYAEAYLRKEDERKQVYSESVKKSLASVKEYFPDAPATYVKSIEEKILNNGIASLFYDENGLLKADAAARFVMASDDGKNLVTQLQRIAHEKAKTEANLDILTRGQRTVPEQGARTMGKDESAEKVKRYLDQTLGGLSSQKHF